MAPRNWALPRVPLSGSPLLLSFAPACVCEPLYVSSFVSVCVRVRCVRGRPRCKPKPEHGAPKRTCEATDCLRAFCLIEGAAKCRVESVHGICLESEGGATYTLPTLGPNKKRKEARVCTPKQAPARLLHRTPRGAPMNHAWVQLNPFSIGRRLVKPCQCF